MPANVPAFPPGNAPIDLNILPPEYRPRSFPTGLVLFLVAAGLLVALPAGLWLGARAAESRAEALAGDLARLEAALAAPDGPSPEEATLTAELRQAQEVATALCAPRPDWPALARTLADRDPARLALTRLEQAGDALLVEGWAASPEEVTSYAERLIASGDVRLLIIEEPADLAGTTLRAAEVPATTAPGTQTPPSATPPWTSSPTPRASGTPGPTRSPTRSPTRTSPAATATPRPSAVPTRVPVVDPLEPDGTVPPPLRPGQPQERAFDTRDDIDLAVLEVRAGYVYHVATSDLGPGVDTILSVLADAMTYRSDNVGSDPWSEVEFLARADGLATVTVTNRGIPGPVATYRLMARELPADAYEPDDFVPRPICPWEVQPRTFYPRGEVDRAELTVVAGRRYTVETRDLATGVDTVLSVLVDGRLLQNDDAVPGQRASRLTFTAATSGLALITVTNRQEFGPERSYLLAVLEEASPTAVPSVTPTRTATPPPSATPLPCQDAHEPDDIIPRLISVGEGRLHTFCPAGDRDRAVFTAKAGYAYRIETTALAIGVDTVLEAQIGSTRLTNDDRAPQNLSSAVTVHNASAGEMPVYVSVSYKGIDGPASVYTLLVTDAGISDAFEPDDAAPVPILPGSAQTRNFYPPGDVDRVTFVAKAGHRYAVSTVCSERPVDTVLTVRLGATVASNDDRRPGDLCSYVEIQNDGPQEASAEAMVYNDGPYDLLATYTLRVDDLGAVAADAYEPDLAAPPALFLGEAQRRTFFPDGDIDMALLAVKAGRRYAVTTCGTVSVPPGTPTPMPGGAAGCPPLGAGVDTVLLVHGPVRGCTPEGCQSDDAEPGSGRLTSRVEFDAPADGQATVTVYNKGAFGAGQVYYVLAEEIGPAHTSLASPGASIAGLARPAIGTGKVAGLAAPLDQPVPPDAALPVFFRLRLVLAEVLP